MSRGIGSRGKLCVSSIPPHRTVPRIVTELEADIYGRMVMMAVVWGDSVTAGVLGGRPGEADNDLADESASLVNDVSIMLLNLLM